MKKLLIVLVTLILNGCYEEQPSAKYQIAVSPSSGAYRLDATTGEVWSIAPDGLTRLRENKEKEITLIVGEYYTAEDGKTLKYLGKGKLQYWQPKTLQEYKEYKENRKN